MLTQVLYDKIADLVGNPRVPVVLVGNKKDLEVKKRLKYEIQADVKPNSYPEREGSNLGGGGEVCKADQRRLP